MLRRIDQWVGYGIVLLEAIKFIWDFTMTAIYGEPLLKQLLIGLLVVFISLFAGVKFAAGRLDGQIAFVLLFLAGPVFYLSFREFYFSESVPWSFRVSVFIALAVGLYALFRLISRIWEPRRSTQNR